MCPAHFNGDARTAKIYHVCDGVLSAVPKCVSVYVYNMCASSSSTEHRRSNRKCHIMRMGIYRRRLTAAVFVRRHCNLFAPRAAANVQLCRINGPHDDEKLKSKDVRLSFAGLARSGANGSVRYVCFALNGRQIMVSTAHSIRLAISVNGSTGAKVLLRIL